MHKKKEQTIDEENRFKIASLTMVRIIVEYYYTYDKNDKSSHFV